MSEDLLYNTYRQTWQHGAPVRPYLHVYGPLVQSMRKSSDLPDLPDKSMIGLIYFRRNQTYGPISNLTRMSSQLDPREHGLSPKFTLQFPFGESCGDLTSHIHTGIHVYREHTFVILSCRFSKWASNFVLVFWRPQYCRINHEHSSQMITKVVTLFIFTCMIGFC